MIKPTTTLCGGGSLTALALASMVMIGPVPTPGQAATTLEIRLPSDLVVKGEPGSGQTILYASELGNPYGWQPFANFTLSVVGVGMTAISTTDASKRFYQSVAGPAGMVFIPAGTFTMGSPESEAERLDWEGPQTVVTLTRGFFMGKHEVTQGEYTDVMGSNPSYFRNGTGSFGSGGAVTDELSHPVEDVSWNDATDYCGRLTERERGAGRLPVGYVYRLPTEAEWEYACRAGTTTAFSYGPALRSGMANFYGRLEYDSAVGTISNPEGTYLGRTTPVGGYAANAWGLYDMHGNVWEWCQDWWSLSLPGGSVTDPQGPSTGSCRVIRGGGWYGYARYCRSAVRGGNYPAIRYSGIGFRVVLASGQ
jgi:formylglycine-generating enzyme required for sulfatase activity